MQSYALVKIEKGKQDFGEGDSTTYGIYQCSDGAWINITALQAKQFSRMCRAMGLDDLAEDPRPFDASKREEFRAEAYPRIKATFATRPAREWLALLDEHEVPAAPILPREDVFSETQMVENGMFVRQEHPVAGPVQMIAPPFRLSGAEASIRRA